MVLIKLTIFGTFKNSDVGILRGLISFIPLLILGLIISLGNKISIWKSLFSILMVSLVLCSSIAVQVYQKTWHEAFLYGLLVGIVVSVCMFAVSHSWIVFILPIALGILSVLTYLLSKRWKLYPNITDASKLFNGLNQIS
uniref:Uncharacterized protein n=1 Tax=viral metagenome TaxID=1070528 RepID=A0A6C0LY59_9ZZZZ